MNVWSALFNFFGVLLLIYMTSVLVEDVKLNNRQLDELRLKYTIDYATDAAFQQAIQGGRLGIDYSNLSSVRILADNTLPTFRAVMALSYDMSPSNENLRMIDNYISSAVLTTAEGYYLATEQEVDTGEYETKGDVYELKWGLKRPYAIDYETIIGGNATTTKIAFNLSSEMFTAIRYIPNTGTSTVTYGSLWSELPGGTVKVCEDNAMTNSCQMSKTQMRQEITKEVNRAITQDINHYIKKRNEKSMNSVQHDFVYLPAKQTEGGVNPIQRPTLFITMTDVAFAGLNDVSVNSVSGYTVILKKRVVGFEEEGQLYYAYEGQIPAPKVTDISRYFDNIDRAAKAGFKPHLKYLTNPLRND